MTNQDCSIKEALADLRAVAHELNGETDTLNDLIASVEDSLGDMKIGASGWVTFPDGQLGYAKYGDRWRLMYRMTSADVTTDAPAADAPLLNQSRAIRCAAVAVLPSLLALLVDRAKEILRDVRAARVMAAKIITR